MKKHIVQSGENFHSLAQKYSIENPDVLRLYHNLNCSEEDIMHQNLIVGKEILIPEEPEYLIEEEPQDVDDGMDTMDSYEEDAKSEESSNEEEKPQEEEEEKSSSSEHEGKHFVIQKGICQCNQGFKFPKFKVTSHQKHYWNSPDADADYLAVTEDDTQLDPPAQSFGQCKLRPTSSGYLPCVYAPAGKWQKTYEKVKVLDKSCVTEISELMCSTGGKITIMKHGQQAEMSKQNFTKGDSNVQQTALPVVDYEEFKEVLEEDEDYFI